MNILAIIPARGGSKGIPRKNIKLLAGKPLITYSIEASLRSKQIDKVIVSTDNNEISRISKKYNAKVIKRPEELAADDSPTIDAVFHVLNILENSYNPDLIVLLQPTSPLRTTEDIDNAIELFMENKEIYDSLVSVSECEHSPFLSLRIDNGFLLPNFDIKYFQKRRQDLPKSFSPNGSIYISTKESLLKSKSFYGKKILPYLMPYKRSIDIDSDIDLKLAEIILGDVNDGDINR